MRGTLDLRRSTSRRRVRGVAAVVSVSVVVALAASCDGASPSCPSKTVALTDDEVAFYRQLEVCASRVTGVELHRDVLPRVESDPETVDCSNNNFGRCVTTAAGEEVTGFYLQQCDTFTVVDPLVLLHEMLHPVLCGVPDLDCDPGHTSPAWTECQPHKGCTAEGPYLLDERICDGTADCPEGQDEKGCP